MTSNDCAVVPRFGIAGLADEVVTHAFSHDFHPQHIERLAAYWAEALDGPAMYSASYRD